MCFTIFTENGTFSLFVSLNAICTEIVYYSLSIMLFAILSRNALFSTIKVV